MVVLQPPKHSSAILTRHQEWERLSRRKYTNLLSALQDQLQGLEANKDADAVAIATLTNETEDVEYKIKQDVPYKLTLKSQWNTTMI